MKMCAFSILAILSFNIHAQDRTSESDVLRVVENFFNALENQDSVTFRNLFLEGAQNFAVRELKDSLIVRGQSPEGFRFRKGQIVKERMRKQVTEVRIHGRIAMVWAPYDLWVNDVFSHCGVDVFTLIKNNSGWRIASVSYTIEKDRCR